MAVDRKLLERARRTPGALGFDEAVRLCRELGFEKVRQIHGHRIFRRPPAMRPLNLQEGKRGRAKAYQVEGLLRASEPQEPALPAAILDAAACSYRVSWSVRDEECVATCEEIAGLSGVAPTPEGAIAQLKLALAAWLDYVAGTRSGLRT
jgi:hypothetical protein